MKNNRENIKVHPIVFRQISEEAELSKKRLHISNNLSESELIFRIIQSDINLFDIVGFVNAPANNWHLTGLNYWFLFNAESQRIGLGFQGKPGDVDIILIPFKGGTPILNSISAIETKIVRVPIHKRHKDATTSGAAQAKGLWKAGFPYVGVLHINLIESSPLSEWQALDAYKIIDEKTQSVEFSHKSLMDPALYNTADRQYGRLEKAVEMQEIGINSVSLMLDNDHTIKGTTVSRNRYAKPNPQYNEKLMCQIISHVESINTGQLERKNERLIIYEEKKS